MPVTTLDPKTALVVIDLQKGIVALPVAHPIDGVIAHAAALAKAFRAKGKPVVLVNVTGMAPGRTDQQRPAFQFPPDFAEIIPQIDQQPGDRTVTKKTWGAFTGTDLETQLRQLGVTQVVMCGVSTSAGVESTARHAHELGFNVTLATDAMTDTNLDAHANSITRIFPRLGETGSTANIIARL